MHKRFLLFVFILVLSFGLCFPTSAETFYTWDIYEDTSLDVDFTFDSTGNKEVGTPDLYTSILSDLQSNLAEYGVEKYEFIYYFSLVQGSCSISSPILRFGTLSPISASNATSVSLSSSSTNAVYPFSFTVPANRVDVLTPRLQFYITTGGVTFKLTGISCKAVRTKPPSDIRLLESIQNNTYSLVFVFCILISLIVAVLAFNGLKKLFYAII